MWKGNNSFSTVPPNTELSSSKASSELISLIIPVVKVVDGASRVHKMCFGATEDCACSFLSVVFWIHHPYVSTPWVEQRLISSLSLLAPLKWQPFLPTANAHHEVCGSARSVDWGSCSLPLQSRSASGEDTTKVEWIFFRFWSKNVLISSMMGASDSFMFQKISCSLSQIFMHEAH